ncbi:unnamed protein product [Lactuca saligna]|uniref:Uncharacterized protein n=1 Tax=Lactuca saligna TaxID=75948 RepID=A0AA36E476_LACSI|nr:unnamed protein product [Lactuca saligna]
MVPTDVVDNAIIFLMVALISDSMLKLVNPTHQLVIQYQASMDSSQTSILHPKVTSKGAEGSSKASKGHNMLKQESDPLQLRWTRRPQCFVNARRVTRILFFHLMEPKTS